SRNHSGLCRRSKMPNDKDGQKLSPTQRRVHYGRVNDAYSSLDERNVEFANVMTADNVSTDNEHEESEFQENDDSFAYPGWLWIHLGIVLCFWLSIMLVAAPIILLLVAVSCHAGVFITTSIIIGAISSIFRLFDMQFC